MNSAAVKKYCRIDEKTKEIIEVAFEKYKMSARAYNRILKVSRTIADLAGEEDIKIEHVYEALNYRNIDSIQL